jgi:hypothetical protein
MADSHDEWFCDLAEEGAQAGLLALMTGLSEELWCAGWMTGLEYSLWERVQDGPSRYGMGEVTQRQCELLRLLAEEAGGWWAYDDGPRFIRMKDWLPAFAELQQSYRDSDATRRAAAKTPVPQDLQARAEGIAQTPSGEAA